MKKWQCTMGLFMGIMLMVNFALAGPQQTRSLEKIQLNKEARSLAKIQVDQTDNRDCTDCEFDFTAYGSECCDTAWEEYGINCAQLEANYSWDCSGCNCPGDGEAVCGDGFCTGDETYENCPDDCLPPGECQEGFVIDCADDDCCPESWIGDGFADCEDQAYGCDLTCYDNDAGDCDAGTDDGGTDDGGTDGGADDGGTGECDAGYVQDCVDSDCCPESWIGDGFADCEDQAYGCDLTCYDNDGGDCDAGTDDGGTDGGTTDGGTGECPEGTVDDCSGDGDCCAESWIGDGFEDCEDQAYGCDLTCYDNDGGDCAPACPDGEVECWDGSCAATDGDCPEAPSCADSVAVYGSDAANYDTCWTDGSGYYNFAWEGGCLLTGLEYSGGFIDIAANGFTEGFYFYGFDPGACEDFILIFENDEVAEVSACNDCATCEENGQVTCWDGTCAATEADCPALGECGAGEVLDCAEDDYDCCPESWIGDGYADCADQAYGCDLTCYDNDGGDCEEGRSDNQEARPVDRFVNSAVKQLEFREGSVTSRYVTSAAKSREPMKPATQSAHIDQLISNNNITRGPADNAILGISCDACNAGAPFEGDFPIADLSFGEFTLYGVDAGAAVTAFVTYCEGTACQNAATEVGTVLAGSSDEDAVCVDTGSGGSGDGSGCDNAAGDVNNDGILNVLDIVQIVNAILGTELEGCAAEAGDVNGDGIINVLDIVQIVNAILGLEQQDYSDSSVRLLDSGNTLSRHADDSHFAGIQMTLSHGSDFSIELTDNAEVSEAVTEGNQTTLVIVYPETDHLFSYTGSYDVVEVIAANTSANEIAARIVPTEFKIGAAYPNPFNPSTTLEIAVPEAGYVSVQVYNLMGQVVATLAEGQMAANTYQFTWNAGDMASGMYFVKAQLGDQIDTQKLMLLK